MVSFPSGLLPFWFSSILLAFPGDYFLTMLRLGGESMREKIQHAFSLDPDFGDPQGTENFVIVTTKNINLEVSVDGNQYSGFTFGSLNVFHREKSHRSVELATACPDK